jgi:hypothetical protein
MGLPSTSRLILFRPDSKAYSEIAAFKVADTPVYSFPLVSGNGVYIKDAENISLFKF